MKTKKLRYFLWNCEGQEYLVLGTDLEEAKERAYQWWRKDAVGYRDTSALRERFASEHDFEEARPTKCPGIFW